MTPVSEPPSSPVAPIHGEWGASLELGVRTLSARDLFIASNAVALALKLITRDKVFSHAPDLVVGDWSVSDGSV